MIDMALKSCKLCCDYNQKANAAEKESLILGFYRLIDEALAKVIQHAWEYFEYCCGFAHKELDEGKRITEMTDSLDSVYFAQDLCEVCRECDFSSPKLVAKWDERESNPGARHR